jgi:hypothetical protein
LYKSKTHQATLLLSNLLEKQLEELLLASHIVAGQPGRWHPGWPVATTQPQ